ncbi:hypothetical protein AYO41_00435 [Verrucomicrobia bacterium SCGC AG-212-E04]|nr:hypothetical protein AYO41_00435 [Verrucomicrobia bacterium SCGC AG-212-E04]
MKSPAQTIEVEVLPPLPKDSADQPASDRTKDQWLALLAWVMDDFFRVPGTNRRFGLDPLIGLIPGVGGGATGALSAFTILRGARCGVPKIVLARMALNILIDSGVTLIPIAGDAFSFWFKSFARNYALLVKHAGDPTVPRPSTAGDKVFVWSLIAAAILIPLAAFLLTATLFYKLLGHLFG